jgi:hypothetical protein
MTVSKGTPNIFLLDLRFWRLLAGDASALITSLITLGFLNEREAALRLR